MVLNALNDYNLDDNLFDTMSRDELKAFLEDYIQNNWNENFSIAINSQAWVCPHMDGHIAFGGEVTDEMWRDIDG